MLGATLLLMNTGAAIGFALFAAGCVERPESPPPSPFHATDIRSVDWGRDFHLTDHNGQPRSLRDFRGKVVMMFFGFTHCPDVCPTTLADMAQVLGKLGTSAGQVQGLLVTVDPARDTPEVLGSYVTAFHPSFLGLRADARTTEDLAKEFKAFYAARPSGHDHHDYMVDHTRAIYVFDGRGKLTLLMGAGRSVDQMAADIALLLRQ